MIIRSYQRITIIKSRKPAIRNLNEQLQWLGTSLGLFNLRDKDKSCFRIFIELLKSSKLKKPLSSDELAQSLELSRGTVVHHIGKLMEAGLVVNENNKYMLRVENLEYLIDELKKDADRMYEDLKDIAKEIDTRLGM